jgi:hypothetical protein
LALIPNLTSSHKVRGRGFHSALWVHSGPTQSGPRILGVGSMHHTIDV